MNFQKFFFVSVFFIFMLFGCTGAYEYVRLSDEVKEASPIGRLVISNDSGGRSGRFLFDISGPITAQIYPGETMQFSMMDCIGVRGMKINITPMLIILESKDDFIVKEYQQFTRSVYLDGKTSFKRGVEADQFISLKTASPKTSKKRKIYNNYYGCRSFLEIKTSW